jgi:two-component system, cell cycle sensor histidine kinase and response regulator CckA
MPNILIADDHPVNRYLLEATLRSKGYEIRSAMNGTEALNQARQNKPSLIISDVLMPVMDGFSFCYECKLDDKLHDVPFVFYTATYTGERDRTFGLSLGAEAFFIKPDDLDRLLDRLPEFLDPSRPTTGRQPVLGANRFETEKEDSLIHKLEMKVQQVELANHRLEQEIENRKRIEATLHDRSRLVDLSDDAIIRLDTDGTVTFWNGGAERLFGYLAGEVRGRTWKELFGRAVPSADLIDRDVAKECDLARQDGSKASVLKRWKNVYTESGEPDGAMVVCTDVSEVRKLQAQLFRAQRLELIGTMSSGIAHDLNNILAPIVLMAPMLRQEAASPRATEIIDTLNDCVQRATGLLRQLLAFGKGKPAGKSIVSLAEIFSEIKRLLVEVLPSNITFHCDIRTDLPAVFGDASQLHQVVMNLCVNAREAMPRGGKLICQAGVRSNADRPMVWFSVQDTGAGIAPENLSKVFDEFFTTKPTGTGVGLATVKSIIREHQGSIRVQSELGVGTTMEVCLPVVSRLEGELSGRRRVLLYIPNRSINTVVQQILSSANIEVLSLSQPTDYFENSAQYQNIDVAIFDDGDGDGDGESLNDLVQQMAKLKIPHVVLVSEATTTMQDHTLTKPFTAEQLLGTLRL